MENICIGNVNGTGREASVGVLTYTRDEDGKVIWSFPPDPNEQTTFSVDEPDGGKLFSYTTQLDDKTCINTSTNFMISETGNLHHFRKSTCTGPGDLRHGSFDSFLDNNFPPSRAGNGSMQHGLKEDSPNTDGPHERVCGDVITKPEAVRLQPQYSPLTPPATPKKSPRLQGHNGGQGHDLKTQEHRTPAREVSRFQFSERESPSFIYSCHRASPGGLPYLSSAEKARPAIQDPDVPDDDNSAIYVERDGFRTGSVHGRQTSVKATLQQPDELPPKSPSLVFSLPLDGDIDARKRQLIQLIQSSLGAGEEIYDDIKPITLQDPPKSKQKKKRVHWDVGQTSPNGSTTGRYCPGLTESGGMSSSKTQDEGFCLEPIHRYSTPGKSYLSEDNSHEYENSNASQNAEEINMPRPRAVYPEGLRIRTSSISRVQDPPVSPRKEETVYFRNNMHMLPSPRDFSGVLHSQFIFPSVQHMKDESKDPQTHRDGDESLQSHGLYDQPTPTDPLVDDNHAKTNRFPVDESSSDIPPNFLVAQIASGRLCGFEHRHLPTSNPSRTGQVDKFTPAVRSRAAHIRSQNDHTVSDSIFPNVPSKTRRRVMPSPEENAHSEFRPPSHRSPSPGTIHVSHPFVSRMQMPPPSPTSHMPPPSPTGRRAPPPSPTGRRAPPPSPTGLRAPHPSPTRLLHPSLSPTREHPLSPTRSSVFPLSPTRRHKPPPSPTRRYVSPPSPSAIPTSSAPIGSPYHHLISSQMPPSSTQSSSRLGNLGEPGSTYPRNSLPPQENPWRFHVVDDVLGTRSASGTAHAGLMNIGNPRRQLFNTHGEAFQQPGNIEEDDESDVTQYIMSYLVSKNIMTAGEADRLQQNALEKKRIAQQQSQQQHRNPESSAFTQYQPEETRGGYRCGNSTLSPTSEAQRRKLRQRGHSMGEIEESIFARSNTVNSCLALANSLIYQRSQSLPGTNDLSTSMVDRRNMSRKRRRGDIDIRVECEEIVREPIAEDLAELRHSHTGSEQCDCADVEDQILRMAQEAYANIRRTNESPEAFDQFENELHQTNDTIHEAMAILRTLKELCTHGRSIEKIYSGSVVITVHCPTVNSLQDLWESYRNGRLQHTIQDGFITDSLREKFKAKEMFLKVSISESHYLACKQELECSMLRPGITEEEQFDEMNFGTNNENSPNPGLMSPKKIRAVDGASGLTYSPANYSLLSATYQIDPSTVLLGEFDNSSHLHTWPKSPYQQSSYRQRTLRSPGSPRSPKSPRSSRVVRNMSAELSINHEQLSPIPISPSRIAFQELNCNVSSSSHEGFDTSRGEVTQESDEEYIEKCLSVSSVL